MRALSLTSFGVCSTPSTVSSTARSRFVLRPAPPTATPSHLTCASTLRQQPFLPCFFPCAPATLPCPLSSAALFAFASHVHIDLLGCAAAQGGRGLSGGQVSGALWRRATGRRRRKRGGGRRGPNIAGINRPDSMDAPPMGGGG